MTGISINGWAMPQTGVDIRDDLVDDMTEPAWLPPTSTMWDGSSLPPEESSPSSR